jgi:hypothetical protein
LRSPSWLRGRWSFPQPRTRVNIGFGDQSLFPLVRLTRRFETTIGARPVSGSWPDFQQIRLS